MSRFGETRVKLNRLTQPQHGFTLIEVMVALAILAVVAVVASQASGTYFRSVNNLKTRTLAQFVAQNVATDLQLNPTSITAPQTKNIASQGQQWRVLLTPQTDGDIPLSSNNTDALSLNSVKLQPVAIQVSPLAPDSDQALSPVVDIVVLVSGGDNE